MFLNSLIYVAFVICLIMCGYFALRRPGISITLLISMLVIKQGLQTQFLYFSQYTASANILLAGTASLSLLIAVYFDSRRFKVLDTIMRLRICFVVLWAASLMWLRDKSYSFGDPMNTLLYAGVFVFLMPSLIRRESDLKNMVWSYIWLGTIMCLVFFGSGWTGRSIVLQGDMRVLRSSYSGASTSLAGNPLEVASLGMRLTLVMILMSVRGLGWFFTLARWLIVALAVTVMLRSGSRGQVFALFATLIVMFPFAKNFKNVGAMMGSGLALGGVLILLYFVAQYASQDLRWSQTYFESGLSNRTEFAYSSTRLWLTSGVFPFLFGHGYDSAFDQLYGLGFPEVGPAALLLDLGLAGALLFIPMILLGARSWFRSWMMVKDDPVRRGYVCVLGAFVMSFFLLSFKEAGYLFTPGYFALLVRCETVLKAELEEQPAEPLLAQGMDSSYAPELLPQT